MTAISRDCRIFIVPYFKYSCLGIKNGYAIKLIFAPRSLPYMVFFLFISGLQSLLFRKLSVTSIGSKFPCVVKKSKSTDFLFPTCNARAVPPARYQPDSPIHFWEDKNSNAFLVEIGNVS